LFFVDELNRKSVFIDPKKLRDEMAKTEEGGQEKKEEEGGQEKKPEKDRTESMGQKKEEEEEEFGRGAIRHTTSEVEDCTRGTPAWLLMCIDTFTESLEQTVSSM
jgi:hypothetical protein